MPFVHSTLTLTGAAQRLSDAFRPAGSPAGTVDPALDLPARALILSSLKANNADIFVGGASPTVSSTSHAFRIDPGDTAAPIQIETYCKPSDFYVIGTANDVLCVGVVVQ